jgi:hypothetical protein
MNTWSKVERVSELPKEAKEHSKGLFVTPQGEVYTVKVYRKAGQRIIKKSIATDKSGYNYIIHRSKTKHYIHRLVAQTFLPNPDNKPHINHIDGDKANNTLSNLEWNTRSENELHAHRTSLKSAKHLFKPVVQMDLMGNKIKEHASITEAVRSNSLPAYAKSNIAQACRGKLKTASGFRWAYA